MIGSAGSEFRRDRIQGRRLDDFRHETRRELALVARIGAHRGSQRALGLVELRYMESRSLPMSRQVFLQNASMTTRFIRACAEQSDWAGANQGSQLGKLGLGLSPLEPGQIAAPKLGPREPAGLPRPDQRRVRAEIFEPVVDLPFADTPRPEAHYQDPGSVGPFRGVVDPLGFDAHAGSHFTLYSRKRFGSKATR